MIVTLTLEEVLQAWLNQSKYSYLDLVGLDLGRGIFDKRLNGVRVNVQ